MNSVSYVVDCTLDHSVPQCTVNNSVKNGPIFIIFSTWNPEKILHEKIT